MHTDNPVALHSPDHQDALHGGAANDNSRHPGFNAKLDTLYDRKLLVMDIGCAGGGFVKSLIDDGHFAVGLEGCDYCKQNNKFEWATIPGNLFNCDLTKPFQVFDDEVHFDGDDKAVIRFDVITAWEVMEHFSEQELPQVIGNILRHLKDDGIWVMSVSEQVDHHFHRCVHNQSWWLHKFAEFGLRHREELRQHFHPHWVRGPERTEWAFDAPQSFHLVLSR